MTVEQIIGLITGPDRVRIFHDDRELYTGFVGILVNHSPEYDSMRKLEVRKLRTQLDIASKEWEKNDLASPLEPDSFPDYSFRDLRMTLYYEIYT